jgi:AAA family ATP:ADP antiporter
VLKPDFARRFNGFFLGISAIGATAGTWAGEKLVTTLGTERMLIFTVVSLIAAAVFSLIAYRVGGEPKPNEKEIGGQQGHAGIGLFFKSRYLLFLGLLIFVTQILSTALELRFDVLMAEEFSNKDLRSEYLYGFWYKVNIIAFCLNFLVAPLILPLLQIRLIKLFIPIIHLSVNLASILAPSLGTATLSLLLFKSLDYSIFRASKEILYMPLSYDARYRAKQLIDSLIYRNGEGLTAGVNALIDVVFVIPIVVYPVTAIMMSFLWIGIVLNLTRQYQNLVSSS